MSANEDSKSCPSVQEQQQSKLIKILNTLPYSENFKSVKSKGDNLGDAKKLSLKHGHDQIDNGHSVGGNGNSSKHQITRSQPTDRSQLEVEIVDDNPAYGHHPLNRIKSPSAFNNQQPLRNQRTKSTDDDIEVKSLVYSCFAPKL